MNQVLKIYCDICASFIATTRPGVPLSVPMNGSMFDSMAPDRFVPPPWEPIAAWEHLTCPVCQRRAFIYPNRVKTDAGFFYPPNADTIRAEELRRVGDILATLPADEGRKEAAKTEEAPGKKTVIIGGKEYDEAFVETLLRKSVTTPIEIAQAQTENHVAGPAPEQATSSAEATAGPPAPAVLSQEAPGDDGLIRCSKCGKPCKTLQGKLAHERTCGVPDDKGGYEPDPHAGVKGDPTGYGQDEAADTFYPAGHGEKVSPDHRTMETQGDVVVQR